MNASNAPAARASALQPQADVRPPIAARFHMPRRLVAHMAVNQAIDCCVGIVPFLGDIFDCACVGAARRRGGGEGLCCMGVRLRRCRQRASSSSLYKRLWHGTELGEVQ